MVTLGVTACQINVATCQVHIACGNMIALAYDITTCGDLKSCVIVCQCPISIHPCDQATTVCLCQITSGQIGITTTADNAAAINDICRGYFRSSFTIELTTVI